MNKIVPTIAKFYCNFFGHAFKVSKSVTNHIYEYECARCRMEMTDTANGFLARLTPKFKETNEYLAEIHQKRRQKDYASAT